jgi:hypothetical protein
MFSRQPRDFSRKRIISSVHWPFRTDGTQMHAKRPVLSAVQTRRSGTALPTTNPNQSPG